MNFVVTGERRGDGTAPTNHTSWSAAVVGGLCILLVVRSEASMTLSIDDLVEAGIRLEFR